MNKRWEDLMKRSMGMLASTVLAAGLGVGGTAIAAGPAAADTGLKTVTISAENYQSYTDNRDRDRDRSDRDKRDRDKRDRDKRDRDHRKWCAKHGHWHYHHGHWYWHSDCDRDRRHDRDHYEYH
jgi:hypothetical protein